MSVAQKPLGFAWLEVTGFCNLTCTHCYADSSPQGTHGTMTVQDWVSVFRQLASMGTKEVQFIGGEPTLYPDLCELIARAHWTGLSIELFTNMTYIPKGMWRTIKKHNVKLATSYYSDSADDHDKVTNTRGSHRRTRANIGKAVSLGIPIRGGVVSVQAEQRVHEAAQDLTDLGVQHVGGDRVRAFGRGSKGADPTVNDLCGHCALGQCAIGPDGSVWPCVLGRFITLGNVRETPLEEIWNSPRTAKARAEIVAATGEKACQSCTPPQFLPSCAPCSPCVPDVGHCDPREAGPPAATATIGAPA
ncbi:radical SAM protein [Streptomyces sp. QH1-20]|uniref:radical SAM protein n=1 Tax=Streptomyces sp. QH1-20 TaxID=3240934 RepID=UPI00351612C8